MNFTWKYILKIISIVWLVKYKRKSCWKWLIDLKNFEYLVSEYGLVCWWSQVSWTFLFLPADFSNVHHIFSGRRIIIPTTLAIEEIRSLFFRWRRKSQPKRARDFHLDSPRFTSIHLDSPRLDLVYIDSEKQKIYARKFIPVRISKNRRVFELIKKRSFSLLTVTYFSLVTI